MTYNVSLNFKKDYIDTIKSELLEHNITIDALTTDNDIMLKYLNFRRRQVKAIPRNILKSTEFSCPANLINGLRQLENKLQNGEDVSMYLSARLYNLDYNDPLLNDWGIYHLHLGETNRPDGFIERTGPLLFVMFDDTNAYFINVMPHGSWTDQDMLRVLHNNWPESINHFRMSDIIGLEHVPSNNDVDLARRSGINMLTEIEPGVVYAPIGGGLTNARTSIEVSMQSSYIQRLIHQAEEQTKTNAQAMGVRLKRNYNYLGNELNFKLGIGDDMFYAVEQNTHVAFAVINTNKNT